MAMRHSSRAARCRIDGKTTKETAMPASTPRQIDVLLDQYSESHLNHTNELIHLVCVPLIVFSLLGIIWWIHPLAPLTALPVSIAIFVTAWIGQFIGHKIEGKKPSFFDDLRFLLIGPLFVLGFFYRRLRLAY